MTSLTPTSWVPESGSNFNRYLVFQFNGYSGYITTDELSIERVHHHDPLQCESEMLCLVPLSLLRWKDVLQRYNCRYHPVASQDTKLQYKQMTITSSSVSASIMRDCGLRYNSSSVPRISGCQQGRAMEAHCL